MKNNLNLILIVLAPMVAGFGVGDMVYNDSHFLKPIMGLFLILNFGRVFLMNGNARIYNSDQYNELQEKISQIENFPEK